MNFSIAEKKQEDKNEEKNDTESNYLNKLQIESNTDKTSDIAEKLFKIYKIFNRMEDIEVGTTPNEIVDEQRNYSLLHYNPVVSQPAKIPILIVYALINRSYILDLQQDKSWIRNLVNQGYDVYLIDWKPPSSSYKYLSFDDYVNYFIDDCVDYVRKEKFVDRITLHGYCMGATMSAMYCSLHQNKVKNLVTLAPVINTEKDTTVISNFAKNLDIRNLLNFTGNFPSELLSTCFMALKPFKQGINKYFNLFENIDNEKFVKNFLRIEKWLNDIPAIAGETFRQWVEDVYQKNLLYKNQMKIGNKLIDLRKINIPIVNIVGEEDHLVSPECSIALNEIVSSDERKLLTFPTGHVGLIASGYSQNTVLPTLGRWLRFRSK